MPESFPINFNTYSNPSRLRITDIKVTEIVGAPMRCPLIKITTNQGLEGYGEVRDGASPAYALTLKRHLMGENPCDVDRLFKRVKQFGRHSRQAGGVCGVEVALVDLASKAYGVPAYMLLGGKYRDKIRVYCDTDVRGKDSGAAMGKALAARIGQGYTFLKMDLGVGQIKDVPGAVCAPTGYFGAFKTTQENIENAKASGDKTAERFYKNRLYDLNNVPHPHTLVRITETGFDALEDYVKAVRETIGYEIPLAVDHFGHVGVEDCVKFTRRVEKYNLAWLEDLVPWQYTDQYVMLRNASGTPICTGEDIYLKEDFIKLMDAGAVSVIHPDLLTAGGMLELKRIADCAAERGVGVAVHMAESPVACMAAAHACASFEYFIALEFHSNDVDWWQDMVSYAPGGRIVDNGFIAVTDAPGFGIDALNDEVLAEHLADGAPGLWTSADDWDVINSNDRLWS